MPVKHARHVSLTKPLADYVDAQVAKGNYTSVSDLMRAALRLLQERDAMHVGPSSSSKTLPAEPVPRV